MIKNISPAKKEKQMNRKYVRLCEVWNRPDVNSAISAFKEKMLSRSDLDIKVLTESNGVMQTINLGVYADTDEEAIQSTLAILTDCIINGSN